MWNIKIPNPTSSENKTHVSNVLTPKIFISVCRKKQYNRRFNIEETYLDKGRKDHHYPQHLPF